MDREKPGAPTPSDTVATAPSLELNENEPRVISDTSASASKSEDAHPEHTWPEGGLRAWLVVAGAWLVLACTFGYSNNYGVYQSYYVQTMLPSSSTSAISWIGSLQLFFLFSMGIVTGRLFDRGYFRHLCVVGSVMLVGCLFAQSAAGQDQYYQLFLSQAVGQGIGGGLLYVPAISIVSHYFKENRSLAIGVVQSGSSTGGVIFPIIVNNLIANIGFKWAVRTMGFIMLFMLTLANLLMAPRLRPRKDELKPSLKTFLLDPPYISAVFGMALVFWGLFFPFFYIQLYAATRGLNNAYCFYTLPIINAASIVGRLLPNMLSNRTGIMTLLVPATVVSGVLLFILFACTDLPGITIFCILFGLFSGAYISLMAPMFAIMADHVFEIGARFGFAIFVIAFAGLTGTPIDGALLGNGPVYSWWRAFVFSGTVTLVGSALLSFSWFKLSRKKGKVKV